MGLVLSDVGAVEMLEAMLNDAWPAGGKDLTLKLFVNDIVPSDTHTSADFTEAAGGGYGPKTLAAGSWTVAVVGGIAKAVFAEQVFTFTGELTTNPTAYGYYIEDGDGILRWAEKRYLADGVTAAPFTPANNGDHLDVTPTFQLSKGTPA